MEAVKELKAGGMLWREQRALILMGVPCGRCGDASLAMTHARGKFLP
jgi:hypothetical protein